MSEYYLELEKPIEEIDKKINQFEEDFDNDSLSEIQRLKKKK